MKVAQVKDLANQYFKIKLGEEAVLNADCSNIVDLGKQLQAMDTFENNTKGLMDLVTRIIWKSDTYQGRYMSIIRDSVEFGSIVAKYSVDEIPDAIDNEAWQLENGASYDPNIFYGITVNAKFYNKRASFTLPISITEYQFNDAFRSISDFNSFVNMIETAVQNKFTMQMESFAASCVLSAIAAVAYHEVPDGKYGNHTGLQMVNVLKLYNDAHPDNKLTFEQAMKNQDAIRDTSYEIMTVLNRLKDYTTLYNIGGKPRYTTPDKLAVFMLNDYMNAAKVYLYSDIYHNEFVKLPEAETISFWQGPGKSYNLDDISRVHVTYTDENKTPHEVDLKGVIAVAMNKDAAWIIDEKRRTTTNPNPVGDFTNFFHKVDYRGAVDTDEPIVVFYMAEEQA